MNLVKFFCEDGTCGCQWYAVKCWYNGCLTYIVGHVGRRRSAMHMFLSTLSLGSGLEGGIILRLQLLQLHQQPRPRRQWHKIIPATCLMMWDHGNKLKTRSDSLTYDRRGCAAQAHNSIQISGIYKDTKEQRRGQRIWTLWTHYTLSQLYCSLTLRLLPKHWSRN
jgi:hypothetical protein